MAKYLLKDGELYNMDTGHKLKKSMAPNSKTEYWAVRINGKVKWVRVCPGKEEMYLDKYNVNYIKGFEGSWK